MYMIAALILIIIVILIIKHNREKKYKKMEAEVLNKLNFSNWQSVPYFDEFVTVKSRQTLENYDDIKFFKSNREKIAQAETVINKKINIAMTIKKFLEKNEYQFRPQYIRLTKQIVSVLRNTEAYRINVSYISPAGNKLGTKEISVNEYEINRIKNNPTLIMGKSEYNSYLKEQQKEAVALKQHAYYEEINKIIDYANKSKTSLVIKGSREQLDGLVAQLFDRTINSIKKIKAVDSDEWSIIRNFMDHLKNEMEELVSQNLRILEYYRSEQFRQIKKSCEELMSSQREFNEYIIEKVKSISQLFGTRIVRNETINHDEYNYIRPYTKTISPFTAEVSAAVFASAENNPLEYIVKYFYPNKQVYPEQIQKLCRLLEELETLKDAKQIIENYKLEYQQHLVDVPDYIMMYDEAGFYSRLGFANIDEEVLHVEYKFAYTSGGGMVQRSFTVPMTEENIAELVQMLENRLTASAFVKEQRNLMTRKLREFIKNRDNFTCCNCGNSVYKEPNLLLEIDHIVPVSKGGCTVKDNLQTLCWKCNRAKSDKIIYP